MNRIFQFSLATILLLACADKQHAGTGIETTSLTAKIQLRDGSPAAHLRVLVYADTLKPADTLYTDSLGALLITNKSKSTWIYAGGITEGAWVKLDTANQVVKLTSLQTVTFTFDSAHAPDSLWLSSPPLPATQDTAGTWIIQGVPAGEIHTQVLTSTTYSLNYKIDTVAAQPVLIDTPKVQAIPSAPKTSTYHCGIANPLDMNALVGDLCYYLKRDTADTTFHASWAFQTRDSLGMNIQFGDSILSRSLVAFAIRFGWLGSSVDLHKIKGYRLQANIPAGKKFLFLAISFDGTKYGYHGQNLIGQGLAWYTVSIDSLSNPTTLPGIDQTIGFDVEFKTPSDTIQPVLYRVESLLL